MQRLPFGPPPATAFEVQPSAAEIAFFREHGYLVVERITSDEEIDWIRRIYDFVFSAEAAAAPGAPVDRSGARPEEAPALLRQAFLPEVRFPELLTTAHWRNARRYASALLGVPETELTSWGHMICKLPGGREAPWHQDLAYWEPELDYPAALGVWMPMHDVPVEMGAMQFVPGSHRLGLLRHVHADTPETNLLAVAEPIDAARAVACPLRKGGATFHHSQTLHYTAPNTTREPRLAYPVEFQKRPVRRAVPHDMPWVQERRAATGTGHNPLIAEDGRFRQV